jgi:hypothetical protein
VEIEQRSLASLTVECGKMNRKVVKSSSALRATADWLQLIFRWKIPKSFVSICQTLKSKSRIWMINVLARAIYVLWISGNCRGNKRMPHATDHCVEQAADNFIISAPWDGQFTVNEVGGATVTLLGFLLVQTLNCVWACPVDLTGSVPCDYWTDPNTWKMETVK